MYATDDRYTDDVHYCGGVLRALDLIDYPLYMVAMNALPPVPAVWGAGADDDWVAEWARRVDADAAVDADVAALARPTAQSGGGARSGSGPTARATSASAARRC